MDKKYFFFDIDGTLTDLKTGKIVPSAKKALEKLRDAGHFTAIATGRAYYKSRPFFEENGFDNMVCNGGKGIVVDKKLVENHPINYDDALALYREADAKGFGLLVSLEDSVRVWAKDFRFYDQVGIRREPTIYTIDEHFDPADYDVIYKMYIAVPEEREKELENLDKLGHLRLESGYIVIQHDDKIGGILRMLELVGGSKKDVVVFGDDVNDLVMFDPEFYKVAMGNGSEKLKKKADEVAPANIDDGIYRVCEEHGWF